MCKQQFSKLEWMLGFSLLSQEVHGERWCLVKLWVLMQNFAAVNCESLNPPHPLSVLHTHTHTHTHTTLPRMWPWTLKGGIYWRRGCPQGCRALAVGGYLVSLRVKSIHIPEAFSSALPPKVPRQGRFRSVSWRVSGWALSCADGRLSPSRCTVCVSVKAVGWKTATWRA